MGEALDFCQGEPFLVAFEIPTGRLTFAGEVSYVWEPFIDVRLGDQVLRFPRLAIDCSGLQRGEPCAANATIAEDVIAWSAYEPDDEREDLDA